MGVATDSAQPWQPTVVASYLPPPETSAHPAVGYPHPAANGPPAGYARNWGRSVDSATFFPVEETEPRFIGARTGHGPIRMHCGTCGYVGTSQVRGVRGAAWWMVGACSFGISLLIIPRWFRDTGHFCPQCSRQVAVAKIM